MTRGEPWFESANCATTDPDLMFDKERRKDARRICSDCDVAAICLQVAMTEEAGKHQSERAGIVAGLTANQRWRLERERKRAA